MTQAKILENFEEAPHISLNQDGSTIDLSNWNEPANRNWSYRNILSVFPYTEVISRGDGDVQPLNTRPVDLSSVQVRYRNREMRLEEYLRESHCDAMLVLQGDDIVYENYRRMQATDHHLCQSVSKTTVCGVIGNLVENKLVDPEKPVDHYIPAVASGFRGAVLQDLLDMNVALNFNEDFTDPDADIFQYEMLGGWHPDRGGQDQGVLSYLKNIESDPGFESGGITHYLCPNTDMLGSIAEVTTKTRFTRLFQENIYRHIGAEADAWFATDATGLAVCSGGLIIRPRELARYGQLYASKGVANDGTQVVPRRWIDDCLDTSKGTEYYLGRGYRYHNQVSSNGKALCHLGVGGQMLYANTENRVVVVQFSTSTSPANGDLDLGNALYNVADAISDFLH